MENTNDGLSQYFDESMQCNQEASKRFEIMGKLTKSNLNDLFENSQDCIPETEKTKFNFINFLHSTPNQLNKDGVSKRKVPFSVEKNLENEEYKKPKLDFQKNHNDPFSAFNETFEDMKDCFEKNVHNVVISSENNELGKFNNSQYAKEVLKTFDDFETTLCQDNQEDVKEHNFDLKYEEFEELFQNSEDVLLDNRKTPVEDHQLLGAFYGLPDVAKTLIKQYKGIETLYDWQHECLTLPAISKRDNLIYGLPTSGGKTLVAEILILREVICRKKNVLFILPFVSIVQEKIWALSPFAVSLGFLVEEYAAGKGIYPPRKRRNKNTIYIATIEKALGIIRSLIELNRLNEIGLLVVDELHLVGEPSRGNILEMLFTNVLYLKADIQIIGMSATIGNLDEISKFLNATVFCKDFRPVELKEYVKIGSDIMHIDWKNADTSQRLAFDHKVNFKYSSQTEKLDPDHLGGLVMEVIPNGSCLVFCPTKKSCENVAILLCKVIFKDLLNHRKEEKEVLKQCLVAEGIVDKIFLALIDWGVAYHHSGLGRDERKLIEDAFRSGVLSVICCTSTLAAGVNLPAQRVILRAPMVGKDFISLSSYKQMVGRAGRAGFGQHGESILICSSDQINKVKDLITSTMNTADSSLHLNGGVALSNLVLSAIGLNIANTRKTLRKFIDCTLFSVQANRFNTNPYKLLDEIIKHLLKSGALKINNKKEDFAITSNLSVLSMTSTMSSKSNEQISKRLVISNETELVVSKLGQAAIKGCIDLERAQKLYNDLKIAQKSLVLMGPLHLLYVVTPYDTARSIKPNLQTFYHILSSQNEEINQTAKVIGFTEASIVRMAKGITPSNIPLNTFNRFYVSLLLYDLWNQESLENVSEKFHINRGTMQNLMTSSATFASCSLKFCEEIPEFWAFKDLLLPFSQRLSYCCISELVPLMDLPNVKKSRAMQLYKAGYKTIQTIAKAKPEELVNSIEHMSKKLASQLISAAKLLLLEKVENLRDEAEDVMEGLIKNN